MELFNIFYYGYDFFKYKDNALLLSILLNYILFFSYIYVSHLVISHFNDLSHIYKKIKKQNRKIKYYNDSFKTSSETMINDNWEDLYNDYVDNYKIVLKYISEADNEELNEILEHCSKKVLIPNWYTQDSFESVVFREILKDEWTSILDNYEGYNDINDIMYNWYKI
jgi:hypothetical protein